MSMDEARDSLRNGHFSPRDGAARRHRVIVTLNDEQMAAAEGWRVAHGIAEQSEALGELVRLGLLSEIAKIYKLVSDKRPPAPGAGRTGRGFKNPDQQA